MSPGKLILINGFNASGKTTIARKYIDAHSLAIAIEADELVNNIGDWTSHRDEVKQLAFTLVSAMVRAYLPTGHDVVLPYIVTQLTEVQTFESIANECNARFYEIVLYDEKDDAIIKLMKRGKYGEASSPAITEKDLPIIEKNFREMETVIKQRPNSAMIPLQNDTSDTTYRRVLEILG